ncbi:helix-turn-helix domain-containing protein [Mameliella alba]|nr:helix-turn-helix domain-containing protein [Mameliella alba]MBY6172668.1 helix-turn-helix domain-containing protein [Mameliella alba]MBY6177650.1 helix-turn-helix domain-containing protein [Mameliella alba]
MIVSPDDTFSAREAAEFLRKSERQIQRYLAEGRLHGKRPNGRWQITALSLWKFQGIEQEMQSICVDYCVRMSKNDDE